MRGEIALFPDAHVFYIRVREPFRKANGKHFQSRVAFSLSSGAKAFPGLINTGCKKCWNPVCSVTCVALGKLLIHMHPPFLHCQMRFVWRIRGNIWGLMPFLVQSRCSLHGGTSLYKPLWQWRTLEGSTDTGTSFRMAAGTWVASNWEVVFLSKCWRKLKWVLKCSIGFSQNISLTNKWSLMVLGSSSFDIIYCYKDSIWLWL